MPIYLVMDDISDYDLFDFIFTWKHDSVLTNFHHWLSQYRHYLPHLVLSYQITFCPVNACRSIQDNVASIILIDEKYDKVHLFALKGTNKIVKITSYKQNLVMFYSY